MSHGLRSSQLNTSLLVVSQIGTKLSGEDFVSRSEKSLSTLPEILGMVNL